MPGWARTPTGEIQTLYFRKRPNCIRIYDKHAEYRHHYRTMEAQCKLSAERTRLESRLKSIRNRMDAAYTGKLYLLLFHLPLVHLAFPEVFGDLAVKHRTDETSKQNTSTVAQPA